MVLPGSLGLFAVGGLPTIERLSGVGGLAAVRRAGVVWLAAVTGRGLAAITGRRLAAITGLGLAAVTGRRLAAITGLGALLRSVGRRRAVLRRVLARLGLGAWWHPRRL